MEVEMERGEGEDWGQDLVEEKAMGLEEEKAVGKEQVEELEQDLVMVREVELG